MVPKFMLCGIILLLTLTVTTLAHEEETVTVDRRYNVLSFGATGSDFIMFKPNMEPLQQAVSVCSWLKKRRASGTPTWFDYATSTHNHEILLSDDGDYNYIHNDRLDLTSKFTAALGSWFHYCQTWSTAAGAMKIYLNGELAGSKTVSSAKLELGGVLVLGYDQDTPGGSIPDTREIFGGELYKLNVYAKELTAGEVKEMSDGGRCSDVEEKHGLTRYLKWDYFLLQEKNGNVTEEDSGCQKAQEEETDNETESNPDTECECSGQNATTSRWEILKLDTFYNKTLTRDLFNQLRTGWNILEDFIGATVNDGFIRHFQFFHDGNTCNDT